MTLSHKNWATTWLYCVLCSCLPSTSVADFGYQAIWVVCDHAKDLFEVRPFIMWNEQLDGFLATYPSGVDTIDEWQTTVFTPGSKYKGGLPIYSRECVLKERTIVASVDDQDVLSVVENGRTVAARKIDYVWHAYGEEYRLKSNRSGNWQECTGAIDSEDGYPLDCRALTDSTTTNQEDIRAFWD